MDLGQHQVVEVRVEAVQAAIHRHSDVTPVDAFHERCDACTSQPQPHNNTSKSMFAVKKKNADKNNVNERESRHLLKRGKQRATTLPGK